MQHTSSKRSPIVNGLSALFTVLLLAGLGLAAWFSGGEIFNPGPVSAKSQPDVLLKNYRSHADFESQCGLCHQPFGEEQSLLCKDCHTDVQEQVDRSNGLHGNIADAGKCASCHGEHKGRDFDPSQTALDQFNHNQTSFILTHKHAVTPCKDCHTNGDYQHMSSACVSCHSEPDAHRGMFSLDCAACHSTEAWKPASPDGVIFDHEATHFSLARHAKTYDGQALTCSACHSAQVTKGAKFQTQNCIDCHTGQAARQPTTEKIDKPADFLKVHMQTFGKNCLGCHDGVDRMSNFDHAKFFLLDGKHAALACTVCHAGQQFVGTKGQCNACHKEPLIHAGFFGLKCEYCHTSDAWRPALLHLHNFPLDHGGKGEVDCKVCHTGSYAQNTCYSCHDHQVEAIRTSHAKVSLPKDVTLEQCTACHLNGKVNK